MKPSEMRSILHAYNAVHNTEIKEEIDSRKDDVSRMVLTQLTESDLVGIAEEILEGLFAGGSSVRQVEEIIESLFVSSNIPGRQLKIDRLSEAFATVISKVKEKSARTAIESFAHYRHSKSVGEAWVNKFDHDKGNIRLHDSLVAQDRLVVKTGLLHMIEEAKAMSPAAKEEKLRKDDDLFGSPNKKKKVKEDKKWGYDSKGKSLNPADQEEEEREDDELFGSPNAKKKGKKKVKKEEVVHESGWHRRNPEKVGTPADPDYQVLKGSGKVKTYAQTKKENPPSDPKKGGIYKSGVRQEEVELAEKQKDTYDQVAAVIDMYRSKKGTDAADRLTRKGDTAAAKKERDYAAFERKKMKRDAQRSGHPWEHAKGSTTEKEGKKSEKTKHVRDPQYNSYEPEGDVIDESGSAIKDPTVKQPLKGELKDLRKGIKGNAKGIKDADAASQVGEDKNWIQGAVKRPGAFTKKAKAAGMSVQQFATHVDKNKSKYSTRTERQANLAQTFAKMKKEGYDFDAIQEGLTKEGYPSEEVNWVMANGI